MTLRTKTPTDSLPVEPGAWVRFGVNSAIFYAAWFVCVLLQMPWAVWFAAAAVVVHLTWVRPGHREWLVVIVCSALGIVIDSALTATGVFRFDSADVGAIMGTWLAPIWLMAIWLVFATTLNVSMKPFASRLWLAALLGGIAAPMSYFAGARLDVVSFPLGTPTTLLLLGAIWVFIFPLFLFVAGRLTRN